MQLMEKWRDGIALIKPKGEEFTSRICGERPCSKDCNGKSPRSGMAPPECSDLCLKMKMCLKAHLERCGR